MLLLLLCCMQNSVWLELTHIQKKKHIPTP